MARSVKALLSGDGLLGIKEWFLLIAFFAVLMAVEPVIAQVQGLLWSPWFVLVLIGLYLIRPLLGLPISLLSVIVGYRYGIVGFPLALLGAIITSLVPFYVGRLDSGGRSLLDRMDTYGSAYIDRMGELWGVVAIRLTPTPSEVIGIAAGVTGVSPRSFILGTAIGQSPWVVGSIILGIWLTSLEIGAIHLPLWFVALLSVVALMVYVLQRHVERPSFFEHV